MKDKKTVRATMRALRAGLDRQEKVEQDRIICRQLAAIIQRRNPRIIHTFLPMGDEVNIYPVITEMLSSGITVVAPKVLPGKKLQHLVLGSLENLEAGIFGTRHPANAVVYTGNYDLVIVPGLAFDHQCNRLGYGQGFYDFFLKAHPQAYKLGVAYPFQILENLPIELHDVPLDEVIY